jgi:RNA polymerase sigma-70 factor (ECF subfamily)
MENHPPPDLDLALQAKKDPCQFVALYQRHYRRVYVYHLSRTSNAQDAQDLTSETFMAALDSLPAFRPAAGNGHEHSFAAWLFGIARHKLADFFQKRVPQSSLEEVGERQAGDNPLRTVDYPLASTDHQPEQAAVQRSDLTRLRQLLALLPEERADALSLRYFSELSLAEVAQVMGKSEAAVKMLVYRGLQELRDRFGPAAVEEL